MNENAKNFPVMTCPSCGNNRISIFGRLRMCADCAWIWEVSR